MSFCPSCGASNADGVSFCGTCGADIGQGAPSVPAAGTPSGQAVLSDLGQAATKALGGMDQRKAIVAGVVVVALIVAYLAFVKPLDASEYEDRAEEYASDLVDSMLDMQATLFEFETTFYDGSYDGDNTISASDVEDLRSDYDESRSAAEDAARKIRALRPPKEYKTADRRLNEGATYYSEDYWNEVDDLIKGAEGDTYDEFSESFGDLNGFTYRRSPSAQRELTRAADDLGFNLDFGE